MKIVQINTTDIGGGAANSTWTLHKAFESRGHETFLVVGRKGRVDPRIYEMPNDQYRDRWSMVWEKQRKFLRRFEGRFPGSRTMLSWFDETALFFGSPRRWLQIQRGWEDFDFPGIWHLFDFLPTMPEVVHCHNLHGGFFDLRALPWLSQQCPVVLNLRDAWLLSGHCAHSFDCRRWENGCGQCPNLSIYPAVRQDKTAENWRRKKEIFDKSVLYVTAPSQWLLDKVHSSILRPRLQKVIPNGVNLEVFHPGDQSVARERLGWPRDHKIILFAAQSTVSNPWKDFDTMKKAVTIVQDRLKQEKLLFVCVGESVKEEHFLGRSILKCLPYVNDPSQLAEYYRAADLYIHGAKAEVFPRTILEAMACGLPVVATAVGGIPEQVLDGETGFLVRLADAQQMAEKMLCVLGSGDLRARMSLASARRAVNKYSVVKQTEMFLSWYAEIREDWKSFRSNKGSH